MNIKIPFGRFSVKIGFSQNLFLLLFLILGCVSTVHSAEISGIVYHEDTNSPITDTNIYIAIYSGDPCDPGMLQSYTGAGVNPVDGKYTISGIAAGTYYLKTIVNEGNYVEEWWGSPASDTDCSVATSVTVVSDDIINGIDFHLDTGATISGNVYESDGKTPFDSEFWFDVAAVSGEPCEKHSKSWRGKVEASDGSYSIVGLPPGTYYLYTNNYIDLYDKYGKHFEEWWAPFSSVPDCFNGVPITVGEKEVVTGKDFQLDRGASISGTFYGWDGGALPADTGQITVQAYEGRRGGSGVYWVAEGTVNSSDDTYVIEGLHAGTYFLEATTGGCLSEYWALPQSTWDYTKAGTVTIAAEQVVTGKDFQLKIGQGAISGKVYEGDGITPVTRGIVHMYATDAPCGIHSWGHKYSFDSPDGSYTADHIPPGSYYLSVTPYAYENKRLVKEWWAPGASALDCSSAVSVTMNGDETITDKDFRLDAGASISGMVFNSEGATLLEDWPGEVFAYQGSDPCTPERRDSHWDDRVSDGSFAIHGLPAGTYFLRAEIPLGSSFGEGWDRDVLNYAGKYWTPSGGSSDCSQAVPVLLATAENITDKNFQLEKGAGISGTVYNSDGATPCERSSVKVFAGDPCNDPVLVGENRMWTGEDGVFTIDRLSGGAYYLHASGCGYVNQWWTTAGVTSDCAAASPISLETAETVNGLDVIFDPLSTISGTIYTIDGNTPLRGEELEVIAYAGETCDYKWSYGYDGRASSGSVDWTNGTYTIQGLSAGSYYLQAVNTRNADYEDAWWTPEKSSPDCSAAIPVEIGEREATTGIDFRLSYRNALDGDVSRDGVVSLYDAITALKVLAGEKKYLVSVAGDIDGDHKIGISEPLYILQELAED